MRFFSNEAKENTDDQPVGENDQERAESDTATVPQQRTGSPWSAAPGSDPSDSTETDTDTDDSVREDSAPDSLGDDTLRRDDSEVLHDGDDLVPDEDASRSDELDLPLDDSTSTEQDSADDFQPGSHRADGEPVDGSDSVAGSDTAVDDRVETTDTEDRVAEQPGAEQLSGTTTTYGPDGSVTTVDESDETTDVDDTAVTEPVAADDTDTTDADTTYTGTPDTDTADRTDDERDLDEATPAVATAPVETTTPADSTTDFDSDSDSDSADAAPDVAAVPVGAADAATTTEAAKPDPSASPVGDRLFTDGDSFNDRLRDVALNFVDNPKEATEQAGALVDEAIDKVTSALKAQKDALAADGDDTEKLRVQLRGYRDILKRLTSL